ncbi:hypothetical protein BXY64_2110 [Marinifilum flexuosum]|uniref:Uncharacterized protein n=1 Tax=Marinifilum flexuosum TaxID=1117708 RepID=A0A419X335_9BACT|nr:hypothetical protein BXY64_2110 [Marinifilum flexuosum]
MSSKLVKNKAYSDKINMMKIKMFETQFQIGN